MIILTMENFSDDTEIPVSLEINDNVYVYNKDTLFEKLQSKIGEEIKVVKTGFKPMEKLYVIEEVLLGDIPALKLV
jgi:hypothetical protein